MFTFSGYKYIWKKFLETILSYHIQAKRKSPIWAFSSLGVYDFELLGCTLIYGKKIF